MLDRNKDRKDRMDILPNKMPFKCVVCSGFGTLKSGSLTCHGCDGKGYVIVDQDREIDNIQIGENNEKKNIL